MRHRVEITLSAPAASTACASVRSAVPRTGSSLVCSELIYIVYPQIDFVTKRVLGSFAITPDDIAIQAGGDNDPLALILFGHDGKLVYSNQQESDGLALYKQLVKPSAPETTQSPQPQQASFQGFIQ